MEAAMSAMEGEFSNVDENDPRAMGRMMRRMSELTGEKLDEISNVMFGGAVVAGLILGGLTYHSQAGIVGGALAFVAGPTAKKAPAAEQMNVTPFNFAFNVNPSSVSIVAVAPRVTGTCKTLSPRIFTQSAICLSLKAS